MHTGVFASILAVACIGGSFLSYADAQNYPERAIRIVVAYAPGGSNDIVVRLLAQKLTQAWGRPVVVDNRPGAGTVQLISLARSMPGQLNFSSSGSGGANHLAGELFNTMAGVRMVHISYKGNAPSMTAVAGGEVDLAFNSIPSAIGLIRAGKLRALAVTSRKRSGVLPDLPTLDESDLKDYEAVGWARIAAPGGTPSQVVGKINAAMVAIIRAVEFKERLRADGADPVANTPEEFATYLREEIAKWRKVVQFAGVKLD